MKKIYTFMLTVIALSIVSMAQAQTPRMTFVEEATQASCPPCATLNPALQATLNDNSDKSIFVAYQVWWPGYDAMYLDNTAEVDERIGAYYSEITGAPGIVVQGNSGAQSTNYLTQTVIDDTYAEMSEFDMTLNATIDNGSLVISGDVLATAAASGDLRLRLFITEHTIYTEDLIENGTNGETEFHHVFKKFVNGPEGIDLEDAWVAGDSYTINETFDLGSLNIYNYSEVNVVAIVQNDDNKFVHQAAKSADLEINVDSDLSAAANSISDIDGQCSGDATISPEIKISNTGNNELTSATIVYSVNGEGEQTYDWTGSLTTLENETFTLPEVTYTSGASNTLNVAITDPNGGVDELLDDNEISYIIPGAAQAEEWLSLTLNTDTYADETYWELQDGAGNTVASGGNPNVGLDNVGTGTFPPLADDASYDNSTTYVIGIDISEIDCYTFYFSDYFGDGVAVYGGDFVLEDSQGALIVDGTTFAGAQTIDKVDMISTGVNVIEIDNEASFTVLSNPVSNELNLVVDMIENSTSELRVVDAQGRILLQDYLGNVSTGKTNLSYDISNFAIGVYYVTLLAGENTITQKIVVSK